MNKTSSFANSTKNPQAGSVEALLKSGNQTEKNDLGSNGVLATNYLSTKNSFDLTQVPSRPSLHTKQQIQCCAKDGSDCSCSECSKAAGNSDGENGR